MKNQSIYSGNTLLFTGIYQNTLFAVESALKSPKIQLFKNFKNNYALVCSHIYTFIYMDRINQTVYIHIYIYVQSYPLIMEL